MIVIIKPGASFAAAFLIFLMLLPPGFLDAVAGPIALHL